MKVLFVCSFNKGEISPFVREQMDALSKNNVTVEMYPVVGKGIPGYLKNLPGLRRKIRECKPDIVHAHFGLSGLLSTLQRMVPVIITLHGSDINVSKNRFLSRIAIFLARETIFVSFPMAQKVRKKDPVIIPCGIDLEVFDYLPKEIARKELGIDSKKNLVLFSSSFSNPIKNYKLAKTAVELMNRENVELIELTGKKRKDVMMLMNASDVMLLTSFSEGSPQFIKEAMACNRPIVSTDVGDVSLIINNTEGCFTTSFNAEDIAAKLLLAVKVSKTNGRDHILNLENSIIARRILNVYERFV